MAEPQPLVLKMTTDPDKLVAAFLAALDGAREAANRSVLDGTTSCRICRALVLEENADAHIVWHRTVQRG